MTRLLNAFTVWLRQNQDEATWYRFDVAVHQPPAGAADHPLAQRSMARAFQSGQQARIAEAQANRR